MCTWSCFGILDSAVCICVFVCAHLNICSKQSPWHNNGMYVCILTFMYMCMYTQGFCLERLQWGSWHICLWKGPACIWGQNENVSRSRWESARLLVSGRSFVYLCVCNIYMYVCVCIYICVCVYMSVCLYQVGLSCTYVCVIYIYIYVCMYIYVYIYIYHKKCVCIYVCVLVSGQSLMYVCVCNVT